MKSSEKAEATRAALKIMREEKLLGMKTARRALTNIMNNESATVEQILQAVELLVKIS